MNVSAAATYDDRFYDALSAQVVSSAQVVVPLVLGLVSPCSVVDVGCGVGQWLAEFARRGVGDILGIDGDYVRDGQLHIPADHFRRWDLMTPLRLDRRFDLALSLEVAEHLPGQCAAAHVSQLTELAPAVLFSAAVPGQGGVHHVNEQWPWYWQELFGRRGFVCLDAIRPAVWHDDRVAGYYRQNLVLYVDPAAHAGLVARFPRAGGRQQLMLVQAYILENLTRPQPSLLHRAVSRLRASFGFGM